MYRHHGVNPIQQTQGLSLDCPMDLLAEEKWAHFQDKTFKSQYLGSWLLPSNLVLGFPVAPKGSQERGAM